MKSKNISKHELETKRKDAEKMLEIYMQLPPEVRERIKYMTEGAALVTQTSTVLSVSAEETA